MFKSNLIKEFLDKKGILLEDCTTRQKDIFRDDPSVWDYYEWNI